MGSPVISATMSITISSFNIGLTCIWGLGVVFFYMGHPLLNLCLASPPSPWWCRCWIQSRTYLEKFLSKPSWYCDSLRPKILRFQGSGEVVHLVPYQQEYYGEGLTEDLAELVFNESYEGLFNFLLVSGLLSQPLI